MNIKNRNNKIFQKNFRKKEEKSMVYGKKIQKYESFHLFSIKENDKFYF
nr:hypothetical protein QIA40_04315 [Borreliella lusitaniae]